MPRPSKDKSQTTSSQEASVQDAVPSPSPVPSPVPPTTTDAPVEKQHKRRGRTPKDKSENSSDKEARKHRKKKEHSEDGASASSEAENVPVPEVEAAVRVHRTAATRESVMADFSELLNLIDLEIARLREQGDKSSSTRYLRSVVQKRVRNLQAATARVLRHKTPSARKNNNSGFLKPVNISPEIAKFTGLNPKSQHSRVDVTKYLCDYISRNNLQNPEDRRQINADPALKKLLNYDVQSGKPLTYYHMQSLLKNHFTKA